MKRMPDPTPNEIHAGCAVAQTRWSAQEELRRRTVGPYDSWSNRQTRVAQLPPIILDRAGRAHFRVPALEP